MAGTVHVWRYLREIRRQLPGSGKQREQILLQVENSVLDYASENPDADYDMIAARFGSPKRIAASYLEELEGQELVQHLRVRKKIVQVMALAALAIVLLWACVVYSAKAEFDANMNGHFEERIVDVVKIPDEVEGE